MLCFAPGYDNYRVIVWGGEVKYSALYQNGTFLFMRRFLISAQFKIY